MRKRGALEVCIGRLSRCVFGLIPIGREVAPTRFAYSIAKPSTESAGGKKDRGAHDRTMRSTLSSSPSSDLACIPLGAGRAARFLRPVRAPAPYPFVKEQAQTLGDLHYWVATTIIILAGLDAATALFHHYVLRDDVPWRMLLRRGARRAEGAAPDPRTVAKKS